MSSTRGVKLGLLAAAIGVAGAAGVVQAGATVAPPARAAKTVVVGMKGDSDYVAPAGTARVVKNRFEPVDITIAVGDTVKWLAVSGSHNVQFWKDSVPAAAIPFLQKATGSDTLWTARKPTKGDSIVIVFAGAAKGVYKYYCTPHLMRGMVGKITVQ